MHSATHDAIAAIWRIDAAKVVATVARMVRDVPLAEDIAQEALEWARRFPNPMGEGRPAEIEVRPLYEMEHFEQLGIQGTGRLRELGMS